MPSFLQVLKITEGGDGDRETVRMEGEAQILELGYDDGGEEDTSAFEVVIDR